MLIGQIENIMSRAGYKLARRYEVADRVEVRIYEHPQGPLVRIEVTDSVVDDFQALVIEALLDEEKFFEED